MCYDRKMSEEIKKSLRTQGKYSDKGPRKEKRQKESPGQNELPGKRTYFSKRNSNERQEDGAVNDFENESGMKYEENSKYSFQELQPRKKPVELKQAGLHILSETENGTSKVIYEPDFLSEEEASDLYTLLNGSTSWNEKNIIIHGIEYPQPRLVAWYGPFPYSYSGVILQPAEMPDSVLYIKKKIEGYLHKQDINVSLNSVLLNCYRNGQDSVAWHSDDELTMGVCPTIASLSLGATRKFEMRPKKTYADVKSELDEFFVNLTNGSLLIMDGCMQKDWQHRVPKEYHDKPKRINLTFRTVYALDESPTEFIGSDSRVSYNNAKSGSFDKCKSKTGNLFDDDDFPQLMPEHFKAAGDISHNSSEISKSSFMTEDTLDKSEYLDEDSSHQNPSVCKNNSNYEGQNIMPDIPNNNVPDFDKSCDAETADKNNYSNHYQTDDHIDNSINTRFSDIDLSVSSSQNNTINKASISSQQLNVNAAEFIPTNVISTEPLLAATTSFSENDNFNSKSLYELLDYPFMDLKGEILQNYAYALKKAIDVELSVMFQKNDFDEFKFLSEITDGSQNEKNQKLISERMCNLVNCSSPTRSYSKPRDDYRQRSYGNEGTMRDHKYSNSRYIRRFSNENKQRSQENQTENRRSLENQRENRKSLENHREPRRSLENQREPRRSLENQREPRRSLENQRENRRSLENQRENRRSLESQNENRRSLENQNENRRSLENHRENRRPQENQRENRRSNRSYF